LLPCPTTCSVLELEMNGGGGALQHRRESADAWGRAPARFLQPEDVRVAQAHLVILKSKMRQRRTGLVPKSAWCGSTVAEPGPYDGRFERVAAGDSVLAASNPGLSNGLGRPREVSRVSAWGLENGSPRGVTWDPPDSPLSSSPAVSSAKKAYEDGYPSPFNGIGEKIRQPPPVVASPMYSSTSTFASPSSIGPCLSGRGQPSQFVADQWHMDNEGSEDLEDLEDLAACPDCGRKFNQDSIDRHMKICKKVFSQKRKQFNSAANRLGDLENASELIANAQKIGKRKDPRQNPAKGSNSKPVPEWKKQSLEFRAAILAAKAAAGDEDAQAQANDIQQRLDAAGGADDGKTRCPHCGRTFNKEAGERHIAICVKTFGSKPGGGRLVKGGGTYAAASAAKGPIVTRSQTIMSPASASVRRPSLGPGTAQPTASARRPSAHRSRTAAPSGTPTSGGGGRMLPGAIH